MEICVSLQNPVSFSTSKSLENLNVTFIQSNCWVLRWRFSWPFTNRSSVEQDDQTPVTFDQKSHMITTLQIDLASMRCTTQSLTYFSYFCSCLTSQPKKTLSYNSSLKIIRSDLIKEIFKHTFLSYPTLHGSGNHIGALHRAPLHRKVFLHVWREGTPIVADAPRLLDPTLRRCINKICQDDVCFSWTWSCSSCSLMDSDCTKSHPTHPTNPHHHQISLRTPSHHIPWGCHPCFEVSWMQRPKPDRRRYLHSLV